MDQEVHPDGRETLEWNETMRGKNLGGAPFTLRIGTRDEIYILGSSSGWRFSNSALERWWGWE